MRWHEVTGESLPPVVPTEPAGGVELQVVRKVPEKIYKAVLRATSESPSRTFGRSARLSASSTSRTSCSRGSGSARRLGHSFYPDFLPGRRYACPTRRDWRNQQAPPRGPSTGGQMDARS